MVKVSSVINLLVIASLSSAEVSEVSSFPVLFFSEQLIPGLIAKKHENDNIYSRSEVTSMIKDAASLCTSDAYFIINQPGLQISDFRNFTSFGYLRSYLGRSSTLMSFPHVLTPANQDEAALDLDLIEQHIQSRCHTQLHRVVTDNPDEVPEYIDTKKRIIRINFSEIPHGNHQERMEVLRQHDTVFHNIIRRLPSPHTFVLLTTDTLIEHTKNVNVYEEFPTDLETSEQLTKSQLERLFDNSIFPDITVFDRTRNFEIERNNNLKQAEKRPQFPKPRYTNEEMIEKVSKEKKFNRFNLGVDESPPDLFDRDLILRNQFLILGIIGITLVIISYTMFRVVMFGLKQVWFMSFGKKMTNKKDQ